MFRRMATLIALQPWLALTATIARAKAASDSPMVIGGPSILVERRCCGHVVYTPGAPAARNVRYDVDELPPIGTSAQELEASPMAEQPLTIAERGRRFRQRARARAAISSAS